MAKKRLSISSVLLLLIMAIIIVFVFKEVGSDKAEGTRACKFYIARHAT